MNLRTAYADATFVYDNDTPAYAPVSPATALAWLSANGGADANRVTGYLDTRADPFGDNQRVTLTEFQTTDATADSMAEGNSLVFGSDVYLIEAIPPTNTGVKRITLRRRLGLTT